MAKNDQKPAIRFQGFTDPWEQRKLGEVANYRRGSFPQPYGKTEWYDGEGAMPFVQVADITDNMNLVEDTKQKISKLAQPMSVFAEKGAILVTLQGSIGRVAIAQYGTFVDRTVLIFEKYQGEIDATFWAYIIKQKFIEEARKAPGGTIKTITKEALSDFNLFVPDYQEQKKIGEYFQNLDNLITLHQRKYDKLLSIKKSMLEKMFPRDGSKFPEIRFSGFTDPWEQRKLGEVGKARSGIGFPDAEQGGTEGIPFFKVSDMNLDGNGNEMNHANNYVSAEQIAARRWAPITEVPAVFFAKVGAAVMLNRKRLCRFPFLLDNNTMAYSLDQNVWDADFAKALFETVDLTSLVQVGALPSYNAGDVEAMEIMLPTMAEQEKIGLFFARVDNLITLHQRKLEKLKNIKKSMLEKMFV